MSPLAIIYLMAWFAFSLICIGCCVWIWVIPCVRHCFNTMIEPYQKWKQKRKEIAELDSTLIIKKNYVNREEFCSICLDSYNNTKIGVFKCQHFFHYKCIIPWLKKKKTCPLCISDV